MTDADGDAGGFFEHAQFALEATNSIIWATDTDTGEAIRVVGPVESVLHVRAGDVESAERFFQNAVHPDDLARVENAFVAIVHGDTEQFKVEFRTHPDNGPIEWIEAHGRVHTDGDRELLIGISTRVTERKRREREIERQNDRLEEFVTVVSHDLRNPLNVALGRAELLHQECDSEHVTSVLRSLERMDELLEDLLTLASKGTGVIDWDQFSLASVLESCWATVETADATLEIEQDTQIRGDQTRVKQLLENLLRNAVEHGGKAVTVTVGPVAEGFYVADDGPGIPPADRDHVFQPGYSTTEEGTGFGLNIVNEIADAHGWEITVTQSEAGGARFEITGVDTGE